MSGIANKEHVQLVYMKFGGVGAGASLADALPLVDGAAVVQLPAGFIAKAADVVITTAVVGLTAIIVGDAADADGLVAAADVGAFTAGVYQGAGAYMTTGKHYAAATSIAVDVTGTASAGAICIAIRGYCI